jgi:hypothetical protein
MVESEGRAMSEESADIERDFKKREKDVNSERAI